MKHKDSTLFKLILRLAEGAIAGERGGDVIELPEEFDDFGPYNPDQPWTEAARDVACHFGAKSLPISVYYGFSTVEIRVSKPEFN